MHWARDKTDVNSKEGKSNILAQYNWKKRWIITIWIRKRISIMMGLRIRMFPPCIKTCTYYFYVVIKFHSPAGQVNSFCRWKKSGKYVKRTVLGTEAASSSQQLEDENQDCRYLPKHKHKSWLCYFNPIQHFPILLWNSVCGIFQQVHECAWIPGWMLELFIQRTISGLFCHLWKSQNESVSGSWMWFWSHPPVLSSRYQADGTNTQNKGTRTEDGLGKPTPMQFWSHHSIQGLFNDVTVDGRRILILWEWKQGKGMLVIEDSLFSQRKETI